MPQCLEVADRHATTDQHQRQIDQHLTAVVVRDEPTSAHRRRHPAGQPGPVGQQPHRQQPGQRHAPLIVPDQFQASGP
jgi:hypothetical protein